MDPIRSNLNMKAGTAGGTFLAILSSIQTDVFRTVLVSAVGATVSFLISALLRFLQRRGLRGCLKSIQKKADK